MLLNSFFVIKHLSSTSVGLKNQIDAKLSLDRNHQIFEGHFPNLPIVPGVCMVQMIKEILESHLTSTLFLSKASNIKFLSFINPEKNSELNTEIIYETIEGCLEVEAKLFFDQTIFFKIKAILKKGSQ